MGSFGNDMGGLFGGSMYGSKANNWSNEEWNALMGQDKPESYQDQIHQDNVDELSNPTASEDTAPEKYQLNSDLLNTVPGLLGDTTTADAVHDELSGGNALNWEHFTFGELNDEKNKLNPGALETLGNAWTGHGDTLKTESENFKKSIENIVSGKWTGTSAASAEAATTHVTENSIYNFTPSSEEISDRLEVLRGAFDSIKSRFPKIDGNELENFHTYDKQKLDDKVNEFNTKFHSVARAICF